MKKFIFIFSLVLLAAANTFSQIITVNPPLPNDQNNVEVIFDASLGSGGLKGFTGDVYAHTGVITNLSTGSWTHVKAEWGVNIPDCKLTSLGNDKWKLVIGPSIRVYYNVPAGEVILKLAFVFRSGVQVGGSWLEGKTSTGGDIFYDVYPSSIGVQITNPSASFIFGNLNETINVEASSVFADSTLLYVNGLKVAGTITNQVTYTLTASSYGQFQVIAKAKTATEAAYDTLFYYVRPAVTVAELPVGMKDGINYLSSTSVLLSLYAPLKSFVYAVGDFNDWRPDESTYMKRTPDGKRYWIQIDGLISGKEYVYQYMVDGNIFIGDPYAEKVSDPWNDKYIDNATYPGLISYPSDKAQGVATVLQTSQQPYTWTSTSFTPPANQDMVIYELLIRDFTTKHSFQSIIDTLSYLKTMGVNTIELMPVNEFEGNLSWGYNPNFYFAVDKYYGSAKDLKRLIDICHQKGIAVVLDMVLNHSFGTSPYVKLYWDAANNRPTAESPFYNPVAKHDYNVGYDMNHESADSKNFASRVLKYWINEFHIDGYRFDLSKGFTQKNTLGDVGAWGGYDATRIAILSAYYDTIVKANPKSVLILEHFADNSEEKVLAEKGMMLWGNMNYAYGEAAKGIINNSDLTYASYTSRGWTKPNLVTYMESHDEEREMYRCIKDGRASGNYNIQDTATALQRAGLTATFLLTIPGPKMIWQFGEMGYDYSINYPSGTSTSRLDNKPPRWDYMSNPDRQKLYNTYKKLTWLKKSNPLFSTTNIQLSLAGAVKTIKLNSGGKSAVVIGNFDVTSSNAVPGFSQTGKWYDYISGDSITVNDVNANIILKPGEYHIYLSEKFVYPNWIETDKTEPFSVIVAPNPVSDICNILVSYTGTEICEIKDFTLSGSEKGTIYSGKISSQLQIPWTPKGKGVHILKVRIGRQVVTRKVVVQ